MKKKMVNLKKYIINFVIMAAILFALCTIIFGSIVQFVYKDVRFMKELVIIAASSLVGSVVLLAFFRINKISVLVQAIVVYSILSVVVLVGGYFLYIYDFFVNAKLIFSTIGFLALGLVIISIIAIVTHKKSNDSLNADLKKFKERDR